jgi:hypothetical protein
MTTRKSTDLEAMLRVLIDTVQRGFEELNRDKEGVLRILEQQTMILEQRSIEIDLMKAEIVALKMEVRRSRNLGLLN